MSLYNLLHGVNPFSALYLAMIGLKIEDVPRFRDVYLDGEPGARRIGVHTRMGGGNRGHWDVVKEYEPGPDCPCPGCRAQHVLARHPLYLYDRDDEFDSTYADYFFRVPDAFAETVEELVGLGGQTNPPAEAWERLFKKLRDGDPDDPEVKHAASVMEPIIEQITAALQAPEEERA
jgi:hypothetical protein